MSRITRTTKSSNAEDLTGLWRPSLTLDHEKQLIYVFGGGGLATNNMHVLYLRTSKWETLTTTGTPPAKRYGHTAVLWRDKIIVYGGSSETKRFYHDVHVFDIISRHWSQPRVQGIIPPARYLHSATVWQDTMYVYGGFSKTPEYTYVVEEFCGLDLSTWTWGSKSTVKGRYNHSATLVDNVLYFFGGKGKDGQIVTTIQCYECNRGRWLEQALKGPMVHLQSAHFTDVIGERIFVYGKYKDDQSVKVDNKYGMWTINVDSMDTEALDCSIIAKGTWNYAAVIGQSSSPSLVFLGNSDQQRSHHYDHFRDVITVDPMSVGIFQVPPSQHTSNFAKLLDAKELSDFTIVTQDKREISVHKAVLYAQFPHFQRLCHAGMNEMSSSRMEIPEKYDVVQALITYLYTDMQPEPGNVWLWLDLLVVADLYGLDRLKIICASYLQGQISSSFAVPFFETALRANADGLRNLAKDHIFEHYGECLGSVENLDPEARQELLEMMPTHAKIVDETPSNLIDADFGGGPGGHLGGEELDKEHQDP